MIAIIHCRSAVVVHDVNLSLMDSGNDHVSLICNNSDHTSVTNALSGIPMTHLVLLGIIVKCCLHCNRKKTCLIMKEMS